MGRHVFAPEELPWERVQLEQYPRSSPADIAARGMEAIREYRAFYRLPGPGFGGEELETWARRCWDWESMPDAPELWRGEELLSSRLLAGIGLCRGTVSFGGVYELLRRLDLPVRGRPERFTALGADGVEYAFSYGFTQEVPVGKRSRKVWYYLRGGERIEGRPSCSWWERGPVLPLWRAQNIRKDERRYTWTPVITALTGLRLEQHR